MTVVATVLRPRRPDDMPACIELLRAVHEVDAYPVNWPADPAAWLDAGGTLAAFVVELDGHVVAHARLRTAYERPSMQAWSRAARVCVDQLGVVGQLVVAPQARGRGVGAALLDAVVGAARQQGRTPVLEVVEKDRAARALYERQGWYRVDTLRQTWGATEVTVHLYLLGERLSGGNTTPVTRVGNTVRREPGPWTATVHELLRHIRSRGVTWVPEPFGMADDGLEVLAYVPGDVHHDPMPAWVWDDDVLVSAARMLRRVHDATADFDRSSAQWRLPVHRPPEIVCHNDFALYNFVFTGRELTGVIDWDTASPGPRVWDLAYLAYRLVPLAASDNPDVPQSSDRQRAARLSLLCDPYGGVPPWRVVDAAAERLDELAAFTDTRARKVGSAELRGHVAIDRTDAAYVRLLR